MWALFSQLEDSTVVLLLPVVTNIRLHPPLQEGHEALAEQVREVGSSVEESLLSPQIPSQACRTLQLYSALASTPPTVRTRIGSVQ